MEAGVLAIAYEADTVWSQPTPRPWLIMPQPHWPSCSLDVLVIQMSAQMSPLPRSLPSLSQEQQLCFQVVRHVLPQAATRDGAGSESGDLCLISFHELSVALSFRPGCPEGLLAASEPSQSTFLRTRRQDARHHVPREAPTSPSPGPLHRVGKGSLSVCPAHSGSRVSTRSAFIPLTLPHPTTWNRRAPFL